MEGVTTTLGEMTVGIADHDLIPREDEIAPMINRHHKMPVDAMIVMVVLTLRRLRFNIRQTSEPLRGTTEPNRFHRSGVEETSEVLTVIRAGLAMAAIHQLVKTLPLDRQSRIMLGGVDTKTRITGA